MTVSRRSRPTSGQSLPRLAAMSSPNRIGISTSIRTKAKTENNGIAFIG
jgi:hypothetical protein